MPRQTAGKAPELSQHWRTNRAFLAADGRISRRLNGGLFAGHPANVTRIARFVREPHAAHVLPRGLCRGNCSTLPPSC
eukprot:CAMPEP_0194771344 /NCGR_PEP_ID=MMETSP0323_2-20130528/48975_1 /TAXON_ID=2866 ORGANISM="Crypthecodinium cohnii, Strain Seligo" /NCGR_SAMPLE_ID=MMETSP0323_2 /ASSEMBLY_ACC=CAM_ASM_000346 /LENGTH=77 /DNA_ID=CAMNT_0039705411 /DNA_START=18 /DNA_END=248 /DNA_ORIENTATION=-